MWTSLATPSVAPRFRGLSHKMTCAQKRVQCVLIARDGEVFVGENWCNSPQAVCPRDAWEGYDKCSSICKQNSHAEIEAIELAKGKARGATAYLINHTHYCRNCQEALFKAGVESLRRVEKMEDVPNPFCRNGTQAKEIERLRDEILKLRPNL